MTSKPTLDEPFAGEVATAAEAHELGEEYVAAIGKVIASHVRNELAGASVYDEPAIALAGTPQEKWLACRIAMEEYGHHLRFNKLVAELGLPDPLERSPLSVFAYELTSWTQFVVLKAIVDLAEVVLMEDLERCSYLPLRSLSRKLMPEERFHVSFGRARTKELADDHASRDAVQAAVNDLVALSLPFFGRSDSINNEMFRRWGVKRLSNDESRAEFVSRSRQFVVDDLGLDYPEGELTWSGADVQATS